MGAFGAILCVNSSKLIISLYFYKVGTGDAARTGQKTAVLGGGAGLLETRMEVAGSLENNMEASGRLESNCIDAAKA